MAEEPTNLDPTNTYVDANGPSAQYQFRRDEQGNITLYNVTQDRAAQNAKGEPLAVQGKDGAVVIDKDTHLVLPPGSTIDEGLRDEKGEKLGDLEQMQLDQRTNGLIKRLTGRAVDPNGQPLRGKETAESLQERSEDYRAVVGGKPTGGYGQQSAKVGDDDGTQMRYNRAEGRYELVEPETQTPGPQGELELMPVEGSGGRTPPAPAPDAPAIASITPEGDKSTTVSSVPLAAAFQSLALSAQGRKPGEDTSVAMENFQNDNTALMIEGAGSSFGPAMQKMTEQLQNPKMNKEQLAQFRQSFNEMKGKLNELCPDPQNPGDPYERQPVQQARAMLEKRNAKGELDPNGVSAIDRMEAELAKAEQRINPPEKKAEQQKAASEKENDKAPKTSFNSNVPQFMRDAANVVITTIGKGMAANMMATAMTGSLAQGLVPAAGPSVAGGRDIGSVATV